MSAEQYAQFLKVIGHRVVRTESAWWHDVGPGIYMSFPYHLPIAPRPTEINHLLGLKGLAARYPCPPEIGVTSFNIVCTNKNYDLDHITSSNVRSKIRRGLKRTTIRRLSFRELWDEGVVRIIKDSWDRHHLPFQGEAYWRAYFAAADKVDTMEAWGAFASGELVAFLHACNIDGCMILFATHFLKEHSQTYPNNALIFSFTQQTMARTDISLISYGLASLRDDMDSLYNFKIGMGYEYDPIGQRIEFNQIVGLFLRQTPLLELALRCAKKWSHRGDVKKLAGMLRWYAEQQAIS
jgi:hypothetical protein